MDVDASHRFGFGSNKIPLNGVRPKPPGFPEDLGKRAAAVKVLGEFPSLQAFYRTIHDDILSQERREVCL